MRIVSALMLIALLAAPLAAATDEYVPRYDRIRSALQEEPALVKIDKIDETRGARLDRARKQPQGIVKKDRDSVWNGVLIGLGAGAGGGYLWGRSQCGSNDSECFAIAGPVGVIGGAAIGALVGGLLDYFSN